MTLRDRLTEEMKGAMKARDEVRLSAIRLIRSSVKNREIEARHELSDQEVIEVVSTLVKQRRESIRMFGEAGRSDLVQKEEQELALLLSFLPQQLTREELEALIVQVIDECGAQGPKGMGMVMKMLVPRVTGRADGAMVSAIVKEKLA